MNKQAVGGFKRVRTVRPCELKVGMYLTPVYSKFIGKRFPTSAWGGMICRVVAFNYPFLMTEQSIKGFTGGIPTHTWNWREYEFRRFTRGYVAKAKELAGKSA
jgi:hypothetical protein